MMPSFLNLVRLPGRLKCEEAAEVLGFPAHDIQILVAAKLLKPLGSPKRNAVKYFSATAIEEAARDEQWLSRATRAIYSYWDKQNENRRGKRAVQNPKVLEAA
jgi:hypothetical protein